MLIRNISSQGDLDVPLLGRVVESGKTADVDAGQAETLLAQHNNFEAADKAAEKIAKVHAAAREAAGSGLPAPQDPEQAPQPAGAAGAADADAHTPEGK